MNVLPQRAIASRTRKNNIWATLDADLATIRETALSSKQDSGLSCAEEDSISRCKKCGVLYILCESDFPTCASCGIICKDVVDHSPEWRFHSAEDKNSADPARCGAPINPLLIESSFGCKVLCDSKSSYEMKKIRKWTEWTSIPHREKSLYEEFQFITTMARNSGIPKIIIDEAMVIHKDISEQKMFRGLNRDGIKSASIYIACRLNGCPRTAREIADIFHMDKQSASAGCSNAVNIMQNVERNFECDKKTIMAVTTAESFIERFCSKLNMSPDMACLARFVAANIDKFGLIQDNTPQSIAAGVIYLVSTTCALTITKRAIREVCGVSEVTINKCHTKMMIFKDRLIPACVIKTPR
jgi:transcription initiation factor TFIIB